MIIITGGAGFIGSVLAAGLERVGLGPLVICDRLGEGNKWRNFSRRTLYDLLLPEELFPFLKAQAHSIDAIYHMGAISSTTETDVEKLTSNNFRLSRDLFNWCAENRKRLIYASSAATYGDGSAGFEDKEDVEHLKKLKPLNPYGWSKHLFDQFVAEVRVRGEKFPAQCVGLKFFNVYGPNEYHKGGQRSVAHQIFETAKRGETFPLFKSHNPEYPDGGQMRDFVWVMDCVRVMEWLYHHPRVNGLYNMGSGKARSFMDLAKAVYTALDKVPQTSFRDTPENIREHYQYFTQAPMEKLRKAGYEAPFTSLEDGVSSYIKDYLVKPDPYC